jgi:hypothetical protein
MDHEVGTHGDPRLVTDADALQQGAVGAAGSPLDPGAAVWVVIRLAWVFCMSVPKLAEYT